MIINIIIVQNVPTQFDVPLYQKITKEQPFKLIVYYTQTYLSNTQNSQYDREIGRSPQWDHLTNAQYDRRDLSATEVKSPQLVADKILKDNPDLVILSGYYPRLHAVLAVLLKLKGVKIGLRSDNALPHSDLSGIKGWLKGKALSYWLKIYDRWHPVGTLAHEYLETISGTTKPTFYFPYNVDNNWFQEQSEKWRSQKEEIRHSLNIPPHAYVILGIMKWHPREDPLTLVKAFAQIYQQHPDTFLLLVGDGILRPDIEQEIAPFQNAVYLPGYVPYSELPKFYGISDLFVHPAVNECWGVSVNEALACGLPVITSDGVGSRIDLISEGENGFIFPKQDVQSLAKLLINCSQNHKFSTAKNQEIMRKWSYDTIMIDFSNSLKLGD